MTSSKLITSLQHPLVKHLVKLRTDSRYRQEQQTLVVEGIKPIQELPSMIKLLYTSSCADLAASLPGDKWQVSEAVLQKVSGMESPEGMIAEVGFPPWRSLGQSRQVLALDGISDPGNMGTLLRTALALGWETVYFLPGGCDPFNDKTLRAARGAHFKLSLAKGTAEELQAWVKAESVQPLVADLQGIYPEKIPASLRRLLVLGNEAHGPSAAVHQFCQAVTVPMSQKIESLNVAIAGGILLYLLSNLDRTFL